jgi:hypothetical protein
VFCPAAARMIDGLAIAEAATSLRTSRRFM